MHIDHIALLADDIELIREFYTTNFNAVAGARYHNPVKGLTSYFLTFPDGGAKLEIMNLPGVTGRSGGVKGLCHIAISTGSRERVDELTERMHSAGTMIIGNPRMTGDGMYESVIADPEGNIVELTV